MATSKKIGTAEAYYIESHWGKKEPAEIAKDMGLATKTVESYLAKMVEDGRAPVKVDKKTPVQEAGFATHDPQKEDGTPGNSVSVAMTRAASEKADDPDGTKNKGRNEKFFNAPRVKKSIHVINPELPCR